MGYFSCFKSRHYRLTRLRGSSTRNSRKKIKMFAFCRIRVITCGTIMYQDIIRLAQVENFKTDVERGKWEWLGTKIHEFVLIRIKTYLIAIRLCSLLESSGYSISVSFEEIQLNNIFIYRFILLMKFYIF